MQSLRFEEILILSKPEKKARRIQFSATKNVIVGQNDVGKSTLIKSLYNCLGADVPQLDNNRWKKATPIYRLKFSLNGKSYYVVRDERYFGFFDANKVLVGRYKGISGSNGVARAINPLLGFDIELEHKDGRLRSLGPAYYFLPFYIDQDEGWNTSWSSFSGLQAAKDYRKAMLEYHLGIRSQKYYDAQKKIFELNKTVAELSAEKSALITVRDNYRSKKATERVDLNAEDFKAEVEELVLTYNQNYTEQQSLLEQIKSQRNARIGLDNEIEVLEATIREIEGDYKFMESPSTPDVIGCPTCGTEFHNGIADRFGLLDDIDYCRNLVDQKKKDILDVTDKLRSLEDAYRTFEKKLSSVDAILSRERDEVTFREVVRSEGFKDIMQSISGDLKGLDDRHAALEGELEEAKKNNRVDSDLKKKITTFYQAKMKESLNKLNVHVLSEADYKTPEKVIKANALGSDLPRSLLAQYVSYLHTMAKFNSFVLAPLVIDSPLQQEQDNPNSKAIFEFIFSAPLDEEQLILGTLPSAEVLDISKKESSTYVLELTEKYGLLNGAEYDDLLMELTPMHDATLAVDE